MFFPLPAKEGEKRGKGGHAPYGFLRVIIRGIRRKANFIIHSWESEREGEKREGSAYVFRQPLQSERRRDKLVFQSYDTKLPRPPIHDKKRGDG